MNDERRTTNEGSIRAFTDLNAWKEAHALVVLIYETSKNFPKDEVFGLTSQIRRAAVSVTSNIAEGFGRDSFADKAHFYVIAHASLSEVTSQLYVANDVGYLSDDELDELMDKADIAYKILRGLIRSTKEKI